MERVTELCAPPVVGRFYLVPTVRWRWHGWVREWPVFLPRHSDVELLNFPHAHYHIDPRFVDAGVWRSLETWEVSRRAFGALQRAPLVRNRRGTYACGAPPEPTWRRRQCRRIGGVARSCAATGVLPFLFGDHAGVRAIRAHFAGQVCARNRAGWVCPHRHAALGSLTPDVEGVITCPLHGLRIRAADGVVLPADAA